jgi:hypothetical protein
MTRLAEAAMLPNVSTRQIVVETVETTIFFPINPTLTKNLHPAGSRRRQCPLPEIAMYRVLFAIILLTLALEMSGCTGSLRLGGDIPATTYFR